MDTDVLIVGAGHTGLAMSGLLSEAGREHLVVDRRDRLGGGWQDRWDEFTLVTPNWTSSFPGWAYDELFEAGRRVHMAVGSAGRIPRRYRGRDIFSWLVDIIRHGANHGVSLPTADQLPDPRRRFNPMPALTGRGGGHDTNLRRYAAAGITLAGRLTGADGERLTFAGDLSGSLQHADRFFDERFRATIDRYIERAAIKAPPADDLAVAYQPAELTELNLADAGVSTVIWATGYDLDYQWIDAPIVDELGYPRNVRGVAAVPGLYFLGLLWQHSQASASLLGPELDGPHLIEAMSRQAGRRRLRAA